MRNNRQIRYVGSSMDPGLLQDDILAWVPVSERLPVRGDVIIFEDPDSSNRLIIHRIVGVNPDGTYVTRGDNIRYDDVNPVPLTSIRGVVTGGVRDDCTLEVPLGSAGMWFHRYAQLRMRILSVLQKMFSRPYQFLSRQKILFRIVPQRYRQRLVVVKTNEGYDLQVYLGKHLVGWKGEGDWGWTITPPFRLFIDYRNLPESPAEALGEH